MRIEEDFVLSLATLEDERLNHCPQSCDANAYLLHEFSFDVNAKNASAKAYVLIQELWTKGLLELFVQNSILTHKLEVKDLVAFDSARFSKLLLCFLKVQLLEEKEAWGLLFLNASRIQESFKDANDFKTSYFKGLLFYNILFKSQEGNQEEKIKNFDSLLQALEEKSKIKLTWLEEAIFTNIKIKKEHQKSEDKNCTNPELHLMHKLLKQEEKTKLWEYLDALSKEERNQQLPLLYLDGLLSDEDYLELPKDYPAVSYAHYLRGIYFYHFAWKARGVGIVNTVGQKNYALFYERLRYAMADLKIAHEHAPHEQTYWAELYNLVKHFNTKEADKKAEELYEQIKQHAMENPFCIERVSHLKKARWGGSHKESLEWAREVLAHTARHSPLKIIIFEVLIEQYEYILEFDKDEKRANAIFQDLGLQEEVNQYFDALVEQINPKDEKIKRTLIFWYEKVNDTTRLAKLKA